MIEPVWKSYIIKTKEPVLTPQQCDEFIRIGQNEPKIKGTTTNAEANRGNTHRNSSISWIPLAKAPAF